MTNAEFEFWGYLIIGAYAIFSFVIIGFMAIAFPHGLLPSWVQKHPSNKSEDGK